MSCHATVTRARARTHTNTRTRPYFTRASCGSTF
jgi:hypothetical protein